MGLMDSPTSGVYVFDCQPVHDLNASARARARNQEIGFVFQSFNLIGDLTVFENVEQPLAYQKMKSSERKQRVNDALKERRDARSSQAATEPTLWRGATTCSSGSGISRKAADTSGR